MTQTAHFFRSYSLYTVMMRLNGFLAITLVLLVCTPVAAGNEVTVDLTADGLPIPGGYVVPERGDITFICNSSLGGLFWTLNLKVSGETVRFAASAGLADQVSQVTSPDTEPTANPATITIHNVTSKNNESTVECSSAITAKENDSATILVEGSPNCPRVNTTVNSMSLAVSIHKSPWRWLPEWYRVEVSSHFNGSIAIVYNSTLTDTTSFELTSLEPDTVYNISVTPCNMVRCNESCDVHSAQASQTGSEGNVTRSALGDEAFVPVLSVIVGVAILSATALLLLITVIVSIPTLCLIIRRRRRAKQKVRAEQNHEKQQTQSPEPIYDTANSTVISNKSTNKSEFYDQQRFRWPPVFTHMPGNSAESAPEYATVPDALPMADTYAPIRPPKPNFSPPPMPCLSPEAPTMNAGVQDVGYCSPPQQCSSKKARKVRSFRKCEEGNHTNFVGASEFV